MKNRIKALRKELDLTQQEFADAIGVRRNTVAQWEMGVNKVTNQTILAACHAFNVNKEWLLTGEGEMFMDVIGLLSKDELALIKQYRDLDDRGKKTVSYLISREHDLIKQ